ncbi:MULTISPECIES: PDDEXK nuclease domain-containing protein [unclassified Lebetimonas]|uniref:PDDEXK nuclease domain-containing protein n=1 Tax=unclassified Lebetimonas TaxID=2648158 RepID=UPI0004B82D62|nr:MULTISPECIES: PDDEXK nuclease domain-containing protein [unclassified Lebetimonas]
MIIDNLQDYKKILEDLKFKFKSAQIKASLKVNSELLQFYWYLGKKIIEVQNNYKWGSKFLENLSKDLSKAFPDVKGFSYRNLKFIRQWVNFWDNEKGKQLVSLLFQIPWGHNIVIIQKCKDINEAIFYVENTLKNGISRNVLIHQIESDLYHRQKKAVNNFDNTLPPLQSDLVKEITKDPYIFDFLTISEDYKEKELENALIENIKDFLIELGSGFAFVGKQYKLEIENQEFRIDLLFYHLKLHSFVVIELKNGEFKPEYAGKLNFYVSAVDDILKSEIDNSTIGILICKLKNDLIVEYALRDINKPIGVSEYRLTTKLPDKLKDTIPSIEDIKQQIQRNINE